MEISRRKDIIGKIMTNNQLSHEIIFHSKKREIFFYRGTLY